MFLLQLTADVLCLSHCVEEEDAIKAFTQLEWVAAVRLPQIDLPRVVLRHHFPVAFLWASQEWGTDPPTTAVNPS